LRGAQWTGWGKSRKKSGPGGKVNEGKRIQEIKQRGLKKGSYLRSRGEKRSNRFHDPRRTKGRENGYRREGGSVVEGWKKPIKSDLGTSAHRDVGGKKKPTRMMTRWGGESRRSNGGAAHISKC